MTVLSPARIVALTVLAAGGALAAEESDDSQIEVVRVIAPLTLDTGQASGNVQAAVAKDIEEQHSVALANYLRANLASVFVNEAQSNPLQPDLQYRGFVASPLLGLPQGLAVYQDGVRINEPFGDTVNWALIPDSAIRDVVLVPGSNPLFGLNTLGGAVAVRTKDGLTHPGTRVSLTGGSFGRREVSAQAGGDGRDGTLDYFATVAALDEDGWRDYSPTSARLGFVKAGWNGATSSIDASLTWADTDLIGNGAAPVELLESERTAIFTRPDQTRNDLLQFNLVARRETAGGVHLSGNVYARSSDIATYNGDDSDYEDCDDDEEYLCIEDDDEEELALGADGRPIRADDDLIGATVNRSDTRQDGFGVGVQASWDGLVGARDAHLVGGLSFDAGRIGFNASTELGMLDPTRLAVPGGTFVGDAFTAVDVDVSNLALYAAARLEVATDLHIAVTARYNDANVTLADRRGTALDGDHGFRRLNPGISLDYRFSQAVAAYAAYSETNRAPSPVELTCADEDAPCRLPNAFLADPPLDQVVVSTVEAGMHGRVGTMDWRFGWFHAENDDDILFISAGRFTNEGYFDNVGRTQRAGFELSLRGEAAAGVRWFANYTAMTATFEDTFSVPSENHPEAVGGEIDVMAGARIPLIPERLLNAGIEANPTARLTIGAGLQHASRHHLRGDEANLAAAIDGYTLISARASYRVGERVTAFVNAENVLDEDYATFGVFGEADEVLGDDFEDSRFLSPGAPRAAWAGVEIRF
ncbi:MAG: TonB-dependent receptor [Gammaproteobacteria bacterium]|nr:TonB-dependent receptor [Gammaproteobacteria bacterium]